MDALHATATPRTWRRVALAMLAAGWGANQFAPMLLVYRDERGLSEQLVTGMFAAYVGGLVPALLAAAWVSQHKGKRPLVRISSVLMLVGSLLLLLGADSPGLLFAGRIASGVGVGFVMAPGTAWVKELSAGLPLGTGARRSTVALTAGFAIGPMGSGVLAQWFPAPLQLAYAVHLIVQAVAAAIVWNAPELDTSDQPRPTVAAAARHVMHGWFWKLIVPSAPWVFGAATVAFAVTPALVGPVPGLPRVAAAGLTAGLTLGTSVMVQPSVRRYAQHDPGRTPPLGMAVLTLGMMIATAAALFPHPLWLMPAAVVLGAAHGLLMVGSITIVEHHTPQHLIAPTTAVAYSLTYIGFLAPYAVSTASMFIPAWTFLAAGVGIAILTTAWLWFERKNA
ncbi:MFS transporter [Tessaracoccus sp. Z1128]